MNSLFKLLLSLLLFQTVFAVAADEAASNVNAAAPSSLAAPSGASSKQAPLAVPNPGAQLWHELRARQRPPLATTQMQSVEAERLIRANGVGWQHFRMQQLIPVAINSIMLVLVAIVLFRLLRGKIMLESGRSGRKIARFSKQQRHVHWINAIFFLLLLFTGLVMLLGRPLLLPLLGPELFSNLAGLSKTLHNYSGPLFAISLILLVIYFFEGNLLEKSDLKWIKKGGGLFGGHASSGRYNFGEKTWYWLVAIAGFVVVVSGMVLDFPLFGQTRDTMEYFHLLHTVSAILLIVVSLGHIYMGTIAVEGALESMVEGEVDENWAREHHDLWYEEVKAKAAAGNSKA